MEKKSGKKKAPLNRTVELTPAEVKKFTKDLIQLKNNVEEREIENKIINQNIFEVLEHLPDNFVDLLFIDPPYNIYKKFNSNSFKEMQNLEYENWIDLWLGKMKRILKSGASIYICCDWKSSAAVYNVASKYFKVQNRITWEREKGRGSNTNWKNCSEDIWFFTNSNKYVFNVDDVKMKRKVLAPYKDGNGKPKDWESRKGNNFRITFPSNIWTDITVPFWSMPENTEHPTQKPEKLLAKIILASSKKGDWIFDPFAGSGTTAVAAKKLGRKFSVVELDKQFCIITAKRIELAGRDKSIQGYSGNVFWERNTLAEQRNSIVKSKVKSQK